MYLTSTRARWLSWVVLPLVFLVGWFVTEHTAPLHWVQWAVSENGVMELVHFVLALMACAACSMQACKQQRLGHHLASVWFFLFAAGSFYIAGEEVSWGQWFFEWETPEQWHAHNDQGETNLHNVTPWLDQKPRSLLEIGMIFGSWVIPLMLHYRLLTLPHALTALLPSRESAYFVGLFLITKKLDKLPDMGFRHFFERGSEVLETLIYYYILMYALSFVFGERARALPSKP